MTKQEARDGFRYLPPDMKLTNEEGEFLPSVVGLRALPDGTFVQNVKVSFHHMVRHQDSPVTQKSVVSVLPADTSGRRRAAASALFDRINVQQPEL